MKKFFVICLAFAMTSICFASCGVARKDVHLAYNQITTDASFKQFLKATKVNQIEILNFLVKEANQAYLDCETIEELYDVKEHLQIIKHFNNNAKQKSMSVTHEIRVLDNKITQTEAEYKKDIVIEGSRTDYWNKGQELD